MKKWLIITILPTFTTLLTASLAFGYAYRVDQMPNGSVNSCANCHIRASGGGARNDFGILVASKYLSGGDVVWGAELAKEDADKDGFSNGQELQDPDGTWKIGDAAPGNAALVTNPGDASSKPAGTGVIPFATRMVPERIHLFQNYPNPFNPETRIRFELDRPAEVLLRVFNLQGHLVRSLASGRYSAGSFEAAWDGRDQHGVMMGSGIYLCQLQSGDRIEVVRMVLMK